MTTAIIVSAIVGMIAAIVGTSLSADSAKSTNETNLAIAEKTNEAQLEAMREQTASDQAYNSMSSQMLRSMSAGVNPILAAGAQPTSVSSKNVPSLHSPQLQNPLADLADFGPSVGQQLQSASNSLVETKLRAEQLNLTESEIKLQDFKTRVDLLKTIGDIGGSSDWTSHEMSRVINTVMGDRFDASELGTFQRDQNVINRLHNGIESSNLDIKEKRYLFNWLDEFTNARYTQILADTEESQTQSYVNRSIARLNESKRSEIDQSIKNMKEQWISLNASANMDIIKLEKFAKYFDAEVRKICSDAKISEMEAKHWIWSKILPYSSTSFRAFGISQSGNNATLNSNPYHPDTYLK